MANNGTKNSNDSQFFITLGRYVTRVLEHNIEPFEIDRADELHGKHTLFGRCIGDTVYSAC
jgi:peptidyl-prolyl cis-trans isomerase SDCCAG10